MATQESEEAANRVSMAFNNKAGIWAVYPATYNHLGVQVFTTDRDAAEELLDRIKEVAGEDVEVEIVEQGLPV